MVDAARSLLTLWTCDFRHKAPALCARLGFSWKSQKIIASAA